MDVPEPKLLATINDFKTAYASLAVASIWQSYYFDGKTLALVVAESTNSPIDCTPTVNLSVHGHFPTEGHVFIKDWEENEGVREALETAGVIGPAVREVTAGYVTVTEHKVLALAEPAR